MKKLRYAWLLVRHMGVQWTFSRVLYSVRVRCGALRKATPVKHHQACSLEGMLQDKMQAGPAAYAEFRKRHFLLPEDFFSGFDWKQFDGDSVAVILEAENILAGRYTLFSHLTRALGFPPPWHQNPEAENRIYPAVHWSDIPDFANGDIKLVWELGRFGFAYPLVRAWARTGDTRFAEAFWQLFEDWWAHNPPNVGPHWKCGQEISFRIMACCFALSALASAQATTPERIAAMTTMLGESAYRIESNLGYALNQQNNHGISEALGLWTVAVLFPEFRHAARWEKTGATHLCRQAATLIYADGSFSQHSLNYHRLMLQDYLWVFSLSKKLQKPLDLAMQAQVEKAWRFLYQMHDPESGMVPNFGSNDGAQILPLNHCSYPDYRPVLQALAYWFTGTRCFGDGPWDEDLLWLFGKDALLAPHSPLPCTSMVAAEGGYYTLRKEKGWAFVRCARFRHRPAHADQLHLDLWWNGLNVAQDPGTFSYNPTRSQDAGFSSTRYHNAVTVDGRDQMDKVSRFMWLPWSEGRVLHSAASEHIVYWEGQQNGYARMASPVMHRRAVIGLGAEHWLVLDKLESAEEHDYLLHWLLADCTHQWNPDTGQLTMEPDGRKYRVVTGATDPVNHVLTRASDSHAYGWQSRYYHHKSPALSTLTGVRARTTLFWSMFGPLECDILVEHPDLVVTSEHWQARVSLVQAGRLLVERVEISGMMRESLMVS